MDFTKKQSGFIGHYSPLMHGLLTFDMDNSQVVVRGFANWYALAFSLLCVDALASFFIDTWSLGNVVSMLPILLAAIAFCFLVVGVLYWIQAARFLDVASFAAQSWARKYVQDDRERA